ncbi:cytochrome b mRNA-processing protein 4 [Histoplasma capsulatum var. duboisii H88]|uniref:Cytochrome b mRNA-processing protein 4 n=1 Tax=Ajellomyces capsulatus (strain H88) TaxID=544711 RepID=F0UVD5_AJEC8|nr:cytochrome b mRNA-processing protein 4 [Histoplasma capsulatum var. duboisii H88]
MRNPPVAATQERIDGGDRSGERKWLVAEAEIEDLKSKFPPCRKRDCAVAEEEFSIMRSIGRSSHVSKVFPGPGAHFSKSPSADVGCQLCETNGKGRSSRIQGKCHHDWPMTQSSFRVAISSSGSFYIFKHPVGDQLDTITVSSYFREVNDNHVIVHSVEPPSLRNEFDWHYPPTDGSFSGPTSAQLIACAGIRELMTVEKSGITYPRSLFPSPHTASILWELPYPVGADCATYSTSAPSSEPENLQYDKLVLAPGATTSTKSRALVQYVRPTEEELFQKFNPELQKRNLETRDQRQKDFDSFVTQLKTHAKSDKSIWHAIKESETTNRREVETRRKAELEEAERQKAQIRKELAEGS